MARFQFWGVVVGAAFVLSGCGILGDPPVPDVGESDGAGSAAEGPAQPAAAEPAAFHFDSGDLVLGPFDPEDVKDNLFDPCTEISDAEFAAAGLVKRQEQPGHQIDSSINSCSLDAGATNFSILLVANALDKNAIESGSPVFDFEVSELPQAFAFGSPVDSISMCDVAVETRRGTVSASVSTVRSTDAVSELCPTAANVIISLFAL
ncbi:DUF3558 family protein [Corynebacterium qintianiae]|uniref:DUF3558 family protein n=1 Tax=Corynebacterium qintianiae TaxID=2709392 RepID=UPI0013EB31E5|nr:DUF3558 family protein [Corynebacterium qintianiae]